VRLRVENNPELAENKEIAFQFLLVRLRAEGGEIIVNKNIISIPSGAIKSY